MRRERTYQPKPELSDVARDDIETAMNALDDLGWIFSAAEVAADNLAEKLRSNLFSKREPAFAGIAPTLYEVVDQIAIRYGLNGDAVEASDELKRRLEDSYRDDDNDDILEEVREWAGMLVRELRTFIESCPNA